MSELTDRMQQIERGGGTYYQLLKVNVDGLHNAALVDMAIDGDYRYLDLRRVPFSDDEVLKALARAARDSQRLLADRLIAIAWQRPRTDHPDGSPA